MLTFIKLGGSLLTDKRVESSFRKDVALRLANEIKAAMAANHGLQVLVGHGSGSFGHFAANRYRTVEGVRTPEEWRGFAHVATVAAQLNCLVAQAFHSAGVPIWRIQPSASALSRDGFLVDMALEPIRRGLAHGLVPLVYGDVSLDESRGGTIISTESIFFYLAQYLPVDAILLLGEVEGVFDQEGRVMPVITRDNFSSVQASLGGSAGVDVTGGMLAKVSDMLRLVSVFSGLTVRIFDGTKPGLLEQTLLGRARPGTLIE